MIISITTKRGDVYNTNAIELVNNGKDIRFHAVKDSEQVYVLVDVNNVAEIRLV